MAVLAEQAVLALPAVLAAPVPVTSALEAPPTVRLAVPEAVVQAPRVARVAQVGPAHPPRAVPRTAALVVLARVPRVQRAPELRAPAQAARAQVAQAQALALAPRALAQLARLELALPELVQEAEPVGPVVPATARLARLELALPELALVAVLVVLAPPEPATLALARLARLAQALLAPAERIPLVVAALARLVLALVAARVALVRPVATLQARLAEPPLVALVQPARLAVLAEPQRVALAQALEPPLAARVALVRRLRLPAALALRARLAATPMPPQGRELALALADAAARRNGYLGSREFSDATIRNPGAARPPGSFLRAGCEVRIW